MSYIIVAIIFSSPAIYYRIKLKQCKAEKKKIVNNTWQWQNWGE